MRTLLRAAAILIDPLAEWARIEKEPGDPVYLMISYVAPLALVPALFGCVGACVVGVVAPGTGTMRASIFDGVFGAIFGYLENFILMLCLGAIIYIAAPLFDSRRNFADALKLTVYAYTPVWLTGIFLLLPGLRFLTLAGFYAVYLLVVGLPFTMKTPPQKLPGFAALIVVIACALTFAATGAQRAVFGALPG